MGVPISTPLPTDRASEILSSDAIMRCGVALSLHPYFIRIYEYYNLTPFQFVPNAYKYIVGMYIIYHKLGFGEPTPEEFTWFYQLKVYSDERYFYTSKWPIRSLNGICKIHDNMDPFKRKFFWIDGKFWIPCKLDNWIRFLNWCALLFWPYSSRRLS